MAPSPRTSSAAAYGRSAQENTGSFPRMAAQLLSYFKPPPTFITLEKPLLYHDRQCRLEQTNSATTKEQTETMFHSHFFLGDSKSVT